MGSTLVHACPGPAGKAEHSVEARYAVVSLRRLITANTPGQIRAQWHEAYYRLTSRVQPITADSALLDLGRCAVVEALSAVQSLLDHLAQHGIEARAGVGPTPVVAQLASQRVSGALWLPVLIAASDTPAFLKQIPLESLLALAPPDAITPETLARLQGFGVRTLGQLAQLDELTLQRQFGMIGARLAALTQGRSLHPFVPTPPPRTVRFCLRAADPLSMDDALRRLPRLAVGMAKTLREAGYEAGHIAVIIYWASGGRTRLDRALRWRVHAPRLLAQELAQLIVPTLGQSRGEQIDAIRCILSDLGRPAPSQVLLWPQGRSTLSERRQRLRALAVTLGQRRKRPVLLSSQRLAEHAIFSEDSHILTPFGDTQAAATGAASRVQRSNTRQQDSWRDEPLHLHWW
jgi:nucleotidyltransferase/DNA polymerase involved in DNA repair